MAPVIAAASQCSDASSTPDRIARSTDRATVMSARTPDRAYAETVRLSSGRGLAVLLAHLVNAGDGRPAAPVSRSGGLFAPRGQRPDPALTFGVSEDIACDSEPHHQAAASPSANGSCCPSRRPMGKQKPSSQLEAEGGEPALAARSEAGTEPVGPAHAGRDGGAGGGGGGGPSGGGGDGSGGKAHPVEAEARAGAAELARAART